jgi:predicted DNA-binding ribbon-helix-helix protein
LSALRRTTGRLRPGHIEPRFLGEGRRRYALRLEPAFWRALEDMAGERGVAIEELLRDILPARAGRARAEDVRVAVLAHFWRPEDASLD